MAIPGWGGAVSLVLSWIDKFIPTKKESVVEELERLESLYYKALIERRDTDASQIRKQMMSLRKRLKYASE